MTPHQALAGVLRLNTKVLRGDFTVGPTRACTQAANASAALPSRRSHGDAKLGGTTNETIGPQDYDLYHAVYIRSVFMPVRAASSGKPGNSGQFHSFVGDGNHRCWPFGYCRQYWIKSNNWRGDSCNLPGSKWSYHSGRRGWSHVFQDRSDGAGPSCLGYASGVHRCRGTNNTGFY